MREIDEIRIEGDEDGFHVEIFLDSPKEIDVATLPHAIRLRIGLPDQFKAEVDRTIGAWLAEGEQARASMPAHTASGSRVELDDAYEASDPKHDTYHERWAEGDSR